MDEFACVQILECLGDLVDDVLVVDWFENSLRNDIVKIRLHIFEDEVDVFPILSLDSFSKFDDVVMIELPQYGNLAICSLSVSRMLKSVKDFFECQGLLGHSVLNLPDVTICPTPNLFQQIKPLQNVWFDF